MLKAKWEAARLENLRPEVDAAIDLLYDETRSWMDSQGYGSWPALADSTVESKISQGLAEPSRPLFAYGNLYESATSAHGPYSYRVDVPGGAVIGVDWAEGSWQIPMVLAYGAGPGGRFPQGRHSAAWHIPPRPIWPEGARVDLLEHMVGKLFLEGIA